MGYENFKNTGALAVAICGFFSCDAPSVILHVQCQIIFLFLKKVRQLGFEPTHLGMTAERLYHYTTDATVYYRIFGTFKLWFKL